MRPSLIISVLFFGLIQWINAAGNVGSLRTYWHGISGQVSIVSPSQIKVQNFVYDGQGPTNGAGQGTVYFWYGKYLKVVHLEVEPALQSLYQIAKFINFNTAFQL